MKDDVDRVRARMDDHLRLAQQVRENIVEKCAEVVEAIRARVLAGNTVFWCGNGGSAADAQHLAAELVGRFNRERRALPSIALNTNNSTLTSVSNDYGYEDVFARQVEGLLREGDVLVGLSTSGNSENVIRAVKAANDRGGVSIGLLGRDGGRLASMCRYAITIAANDTARIQEMHILIGHIICDLIESSITD